MTWELLAPLAPQLGLSFVFLVMLVITTTGLVKYFTKELEKRDKKIDDSVSKFMELAQLEIEKRNGLVKEVTESSAKMTQVVEKNTQAIDKLNETLVDKVYDLLRRG